MVPVRLTGPRLAIREYHHTDGDVDALHALFGDPEVTRHLPFEPHDRETCADQIELYLEEAMAEQRDTYRLAVTRLADAEEPRDATPIGQASLTLGEHGAADLGCVLGHEFQGSGHGREVTALLCVLGFGVLGLHRLTARAETANAAAAKVLTGLGFRPEERARQDRLPDGERSGSDHYVLLADAWPGPADRRPAERRPEGAGG
ncbi:GNAT family N-acetyltransferase [Kitasatospora sp. NPDC085464]|uniref:GNAT family N-acetyltransferase n=1 Tax=Kitasatospora sp. NPDC085464 TaxID=3364063 RepID=UPI0037CA300A